MSFIKVVIAENEAAIDPEVGAARLKQSGVGKVSKILGAVVVDPVNLRKRIKGIFPVRVCRGGTTLDGTAVESQALGAGGAVTRVEEDDEWPVFSIIDLVEVEAKRHHFRIAFREVGRHGHCGVDAVEFNILVLRAVSQNFGRILANAEKVFTARALVDAPGRRGGGAFERGGLEVILKE